MFVSQPIAPLALLVWPWENVIVVAIIVNLWWALSIRYHVVVPSVAYWGALFVRLKWITCPVAAILLFLRGQKLQAAIAFFWPLVVVLLSIVPTTKVGPIQKMFMKCFGYEATAMNPLSS
jgi:hypothetical protein